MNVLRLKETRLMNKVEFLEKTVFFFVRPESYWVMCYVQLTFEILLVFEHCLWYKLRYLERNRTIFSLSDEITQVNILSILELQKQIVYTKVFEVADYDKRVS